jgi:CO dehydrogenase nickel-insertion accessory protein CooC1
MHLRREIDELLDKTIVIKEELKQGHNKDQKFVELAMELDEIKNKIKDKTKEGRVKGLWTESPEFYAQSIF